MELIKSLKLKLFANPQAQLIKKNYKESSYSSKLANKQIKDFLTRYLARLFNYVDNAYHKRKKCETNKLKAI